MPHCDKKNIVKKYLYRYLKSLWAQDSKSAFKKNQFSALPLWTSNILLSACLKSESFRRIRIGDNAWNCLIRRENQKIFLKKCLGTMLFKVQNGSAENWVFWKQIWNAELTRIFKYINIFFFTIFFLSEPT